MISRKNFWIAILLLNLVAVPTIAWMRRPSIMRVQTPAGASELPKLGSLRDFSLTEASGRSFERSDLAGRVWIADFIFTNCPGQCPLMSAAMNSLAKRLPSTVGFLSFTVDPTRDTPEILRRYAANFPVEEGRWFFLTGLQDQLSNVMEDCHLGRIEDPNGHSLRFVLLDGSGNIRGYYDFSDPASIEKLALEAAKLSKGDPLS